MKKIIFSKLEKEAYKIKINKNLDKIALENSPALIEKRKKAEEIISRVGLPK